MPYAAEMIHGLSGHIRPSKFMLAFDTFLSYSAAAWAGQNNHFLCISSDVWCDYEGWFEGNRTLTNTFLWIFYNHQTHPAFDRKMPSVFSFLWCFLWKRFKVDSLVNQNVSSWKWGGNGHFINIQQASLMHTFFFNGMLLVSKYLHRIIFHDVY